MGRERFGRVSRTSAFRRSDFPRARLFQSWLVPCSSGAQSLFGSGARERFSSSAGDIIPRTIHLTTCSRWNPWRLLTSYFLASQDTSRSRSFEI